MDHGVDTHDASIGLDDGAPSLNMPLLAQQQPSQQASAFKPYSSNFQIPEIPYLNGSAFPMTNGNNVQKQDDHLRVRHSSLSPTNTNNGFTSGLVESLNSLAGNYSSFNNQTPSITTSQAINAMQHKYSAEYGNNRAPNNNFLKPSSQTATPSLHELHQKLHTIDENLHDEEKRLREIGMYRNRQELNKNKLSSLSSYYGEEVS